MATTSTAVSAGFEAYMDLGDIKGESSKENYAGQIEVLSFEFTAAHTGKAYGTGRGTGKAQVNDFVFVKKVDKASPTLFQKCCNGDTIPQAVLRVCKRAGGSKPIEYLKYTFKSVMLSEVTQGPLDGADPIPTERVAISFGSCGIDYQPQGKDGKASGGPIHGGWDLDQAKTV